MMGRISTISIIVLLAVYSHATHAATTWIKNSVKVESCSTVCSRNGLENVLSAKGHSSVCALNFEGEFIPGTDPEQTNMHCRARVGTDKHLLIGSLSEIYCLCASDGANRGTDYAWINSKASHKSCTDTCKETSPLYTYPAYGSFASNQWLQVCTSQLGEIGFVQHHKQHCSVDDAKAPFGCLCTQMYAGDLDTDRDP